MDDELMAIRFVKKWTGTGYNTGDVCAKPVDLAKSLIKSGIAVPVGDHVERAVAGGDAELRKSRR
jgi:hypothetical protein